MSDPPEPEMMAYGAERSETDERSEPAGERSESTRGRDGNSEPIHQAIAPQRFGERRDLNL